MSETDEISQRAKARVGTVLRGKWHLDRVLGVGGTACVYAATHRNRSRVAIKMLHAEYAANRSIVQRFQREGYVGNGVGHPGIVQVVDDDVTEDGQPYLVMELLEGETIGDRVERVGRLPPFEVAAIGCRVLEVLIAAHAHNVVHRDLKPDNVFLTRVGQLKVLDFGIARHRETAMETTTGTLQGSLLGTPGFMAPEQALGKWSDVDGRTDIWAVGATLFTVLTGRFTHEADSVQEQLVMAATRRAQRVHDVAPNTPGWLAGIIDRALSFEPEGRFSDAQSMLTALEDALDGVELPPLSVPEKPISVLRTPQFPEAATRSGESETIVSVQAMAHSSPQLKEPSRRWPVVLAALAVAALAGIVVGFSSGPPKDEPPANETSGVIKTAATGAHLEPKAIAPPIVEPPPPKPPEPELEKPLAVTPVTATPPKGQGPKGVTVGIESTRHKPDRTQTKKPDSDKQNGTDKPAQHSTPAENPFDSRH